MNNTPALPAGFEINPPPPGFETKPPRKRGLIGRNGPKSVNPSVPLVVSGVVDGDTVRTQAGPNARLYGADAFEMGQQAIVDGKPVPIGTQARNSLAPLATPDSRLMPMGPPSYGRPVVALERGGIDAGRTQIESGLAVPVPRFMQSDQPRLKDYVSAQRDAIGAERGAYAGQYQDPASYRKQGDAAPMTGKVPMTAPQYSEYVQLMRNPKTTPEQLDAFATKNGRKLGNAPELLSFMRRNPRAIVNNIWQQEDVQGSPVVKDGQNVVVRHLGALNEGIADTLGLPVDLVNTGLSGLDYAADKVYNDGIRLSGDKPLLGSESIRSGFRALGIGQLDESFAPRSTLETYTQAGARGIGQAVVPIGGTLATGGRLALRAPSMLTAASPTRQAVRGTLVDAAKAPSVAVATELGGNVGANLAGEAANQYAPGNPYAQIAAQTLGAVGGGGMGYGLTRRNYPQPPSGFQIADDLTAHSTQSFDVADTRARGEPPLPEGFTRNEALNDTGLENPAIKSERLRDVIDVMRAQRLGQPMTPAQMDAMSQNIAPGDVLPIASNEVGSLDELVQSNAGLYPPVKATNETNLLTSQRLQTASGGVVPKRGPVDLATYLRTQGGLQDQGKELSTMGITNASRDFDFARGEQRFGPMVNDNGLSLDEAALRAWEAGYFPDMAERPTVAEFLDAVDDTYKGNRRAFLPDDYAEIDAFDNARATREQVERSPMPLYSDEGQPVGLNDLEANTPPIQAYEDWPDGGPDFAGNINLKKLESPQDIARALAQTNNRVGFDAATRGRVTQAETARLASDLGMTADNLLSRRNGQALNAEEALAARQILAKSGNELVNMARKVRQMENPGDEVLADFQTAWVRHAAIQEQVAGMTAEAGRTLQQFRMMASAKDVNGSVLAAIAKRGGSPENARDAAETLLDAFETSPGNFNTLTRDALKPKFKDKLIELWYNSLLSGLQTHVVNIVSNTLTSLGQLPEHLTAATIGAGRALAARNQIDRVLFSEVGARAVGLMAGTREGLAQAARTFKTGEPSDFVTKVEAQSQKAISGKKGELVRIPSRALAAEDELFKAMARRMELHGLAVREAGKEGLKGDAARKRAADLVANPTDEMLERALDYGRYLTFQRQLGPVGSAISGITQNAPILKLILPFVRTPTNLIKFSIERSPFAPLLKEWRADIAAKGARRDLAIAKSMVGTGLGMAIAEMAANGLITGGAPTDRGREGMMRANGWQPYSFKVGDKYYSYSRLDPFSTTIGVAADMATKYDGLSERQKEDAAVMVVTSIMANLSNKTWLSGVSDMMEAINDPERYAAGFGKRMVGSLTVPTVFNQIARTVDPIARQRDDYGDAIANRIPGMSDDLYPMRNVLGEPIVSEGGVGPDILSPIWESTDRNDPVLEKLLKARIKINKPQRKDMPAKDWDAFQEAIGRYARPALAAEVLQPAFDALTPEKQLKAVQKIMKAARADAKAELFGGVAPKGADKPSPPKGFTTAATGKDDVYGTLLSEIPGVVATSGFRDEGYQSDMRRRGYKPASNSGHLDGSSLDLKPPPGKSMGWLQARVRSLYPKAKMLNEGDHLHTTFPGWFGAPTLGNAKSAGLANPNREAPPLPAGFVIQ